MLICRPGAHCSSNRQIISDDDSVTVFRACGVFDESASASNANGSCVSTTMQGQEAVKCQCKDDACNGSGNLGVSFKIVMAVVCAAKMILG